MSTVIIKNVNIILEDQVIANSWLAVKDGLITQIGLANEYAPQASNQDELIDGNGGYVAAGFIDVHVHGGASGDFMDSSKEVLDQITRFHMEQGTTGILATTVTGSREQLQHVISEVAEYRKQEMPFAQLLGVHLEGPFVNPKWKGAQNEAYMIQPQPQWLEEWEKQFPGIIKIQTLAPEIEGAYAYIEQLKSYGIVAACGHTDATYAEIEKAVEHGLSHAVHTFNAMKALHHREPGTVGAVLTNTNIMAEVIADGKHVHPAAIKLLVQAKGVDGVLLVTDAMSAAGMPDGQYELGGLPVIVEQGTARLMEGNLAGSTLTMIEGYRYLVEEVGLTLSEASRLASLNPARVLGISEACGSIAEGKRGDLVILDEQLTIKQVLIAGKQKL